MSDASAHKENGFAKPANGPVGAPKGATMMLARRTGWNPPRTGTVNYVASETRPLDPQA
jgi:hypothetical protein